MLTDAVSHACTPALTSSSSPRPLTRNGTSTSSDSPPTQSVSTRGEMTAGFGASIVAPAVTGMLPPAGRRSGSGSRLPEQLVEIEGVRHPELDAALGGMGPLLAGPVPGELQAVGVRIGEVEGDADPVVRGALHRDPRGEQPAHRDREIPPGGIANGDVVEPGMARRRRLGAAALPGIEAEMVVIVAGGDERGAVPVTRDEVESEHAAVEPDGAVEIAHLEVNVSDVRPGGDAIAVERRGLARGVGGLPGHPFMLGPESPPVKSGGAGAGPASPRRPR